MGVVDLLGQVLPLAHDIGAPHQETAPKSGGGGANAVLVGAGVAATIGLAGGLIWVRERSRTAGESAAVEGDANADGDEQRAGAALEPGDHPRPRQDPA